MTAATENFHVDVEAWTAGQAAKVEELSALLSGKNLGTVGEMDASTLRSEMAVLKKRLADFVAKLSTI